MCVCGNLKTKAENKIYSMEILQLKPECDLVPVPEEENTDEMVSTEEERRKQRTRKGSKPRKKERREEDKGTGGGYKTRRGRKGDKEIK